MIYEGHKSQIISYKYEAILQMIYQRKTFNHDPILS